jgi:Ca2+-binding EF-hand superfamily protein
MLYRALLVALLIFGLNSLASAQFVDDEEEQGASQDDGAPADRGRRERGTERGERGERGGRGNRGEGGEGFRGRAPRSNPLFEALDVNGDGMIDARELRQAIRNLRELDTDGDGNISLEEASPRGGPGGFGGRGGGDPEAMVDRIMENDANGDGQLTQDEIPEYLARMLTGADTNADGAISREELQQAMQNMRGGFGGPGEGGAGFGGRGGFGGMADPETMARQIMAADRNGDGLISRNEMTPQMAAMLQGADTNGDGALNAKEVRQAVEMARQRMQQFRGQGGGRGGFNRGERGGEFDPQQQRRRGRNQEQE